MAMGRKSRGEQQERFWISCHELPRTMAHPFYEQVNRHLDKHGFDRFAESVCAQFYASEMGRPSLAPGVYFRLLLIGYFEGIDSERGIAWRAADSLALRHFLGMSLEQTPADHSTISRTRRLIAVETHQEVFGWVLARLAEAGLLKGKTMGVDATTLEANAALRSIVRRDNGQGYHEFLVQLAKESGIATPTREQLARLDRKRAKKGSNQDWVNPHDPDARITKMKDGRTHLAHKAEHAVDLETGAVVAVVVAAADEGDTTTIPKTVSEAGINIAEAGRATADQENASVMPTGPLNVVGDKGYHSNESLKTMDKYEVRSYISEPDRGRRRWKQDAQAQQAVYGNRRRIKSEHGKSLLRRRGELVERSFAHAYETGGMRRLHLRDRDNILKRLLIHLCGFNLSLLMRKYHGKGTPRGWQGYAVNQYLAFLQLWIALLKQHQHLSASESQPAMDSTTQHWSMQSGQELTSATGC
jgi:transposase